MRKILLTLAAFALALTEAKASVEINETNFPDENLRNYASQYDEDGNGTLSDDELAQITDINAGDILNLKGAEHFKNLEFLCLWYGSTENPSIASIDPSLFPKLYRFSLQDCGNVTALDFSKNPLLTNFEMLRCPNTSSVTLPTSVEEIVLDGMTKLTTLSVSQLPNLRMFHMHNSGITDLSFSANSVLSSVSITGDEDQKQVLNSLNLENCDGLENIDIRYTTIKTLTMKHLPIVRALMLLYNDITNTTIDDCAEFNDITCNDNQLGTLCLTNNPLLQAINTENNRLQVLISDNCPTLGWVQAYDNKLMWLDLKDVKKQENIEESMLQIDNQTPSKVAYKLSATEVGLLVHERFDVTRVLNLRAKGLSQTARETTVDGIRYFVFYDNGPDTPNLVGSDCYYEYETKWPYPWMEENSKDNNLPVTLNVTSWTKHQAFLTLSTNRVEGKYGEPAPAAPTVTRSQDYDGKITFSSSNEKVVKVDSDTGQLTVVGAGTAIISVNGTETDYRLAPLTKTYTVFIDKATPVIAFEKDHIDALIGEPIPENKLDKGLYDGEILYTSSDEDIAGIGTDGQIIMHKDGTVTITANGPETMNCYQALSASYTLTIEDPDAIENVHDNDNINKNVIYNLSGQRLDKPQKGLNIVNGKKVVII